MPYRITQCYLPPDRGDIPAFTPSEAGIPARRRSPIQVLTGPTSVTFVHATNSANHYATPPTGKTDGRTDRHDHITFSANVVGNYRRHKSERWGLLFGPTRYISIDEYIIILYYANSASEVTTLWRYTNLFIIIIIIKTVDLTFSKNIHSKR